MQDDLVLWCTEECAATTTTTYRMQQDLNKTTEWKNNWCVIMNKEKSPAPLFSLFTKIQAGQLHIDNTPLRYNKRPRGHIAHLNHFG
jgi:hypothetical protein